MAHPLPRATVGTREVALPVSPDRSRAAAALAAFALVLAMLLSGAVTARPARASSVEDTFTSKLNHARSARDIPQLTTRSHLVAVAREQAAKMAGQSRLFHNASLSSDVNNWRWVGENVGYGPDVRTVHVAFMNSPGHRANILDRDYNEVGVGAVVRDGRVWVAQVFRQRARTSTSSVRTSSAVATFQHTLRLTSRGAAVKRVQARLGLSRTGYYGQHTKDAVSQFQRNQGWNGSGHCGPKTWSRLF